MTALLKKRALAEYSQVIQEDAKPLKRLRLVNKTVSPSIELNFQAATNSQESLQILLKLEESLPIDGEHVCAVLRELLDYFSCEKEAMVRCKIANIIRELARIPGFNHDLYANDVISLLKTEKSHRVISQLIEALIVIGQVEYNNSDMQERLISIAFKHLSDSGHLVRSSCLELLGKLGTADSQTGTSRLPLQKVMVDHMEDQDSRVRRSAFLAILNLHQRGIQIDLTMYDHCCRSLKDDYEGVRMSAVKLIWVLCNLYPESMVPVADTGEEIRLVDDGFVKICNTINDLAMKVRKEAASLLGSLHLVSPRFLEQTLDKKLMSNMRRKRTAHERARDNYMSGEWSTGQKFGDDAPNEAVSPENVSLMNSGACGAFIHGLEDEYLDVRNAALDSLCELSANSPSFARMAQDSLIDMFNDEIEMVRLNAINSMQKISAHVVLREDQLEVVLGVLQDFNFLVREALREMLGNMNLATSSCLNQCILQLLDNLKRYPQDRLSIWRCMKKLGHKVPNLTLSLIPDLLCIQPYFSTPEPDMDDPAYIGVLLLVFNASESSPTMLPMFHDYIWRHYSYLRSSIPDLVPVLPFHGGQSKALEVKSISETPIDMLAFFSETSARLENLNHLDADVAEQLLEMTVLDLQRVSELDTKFSATAEFMSIFLQAQLLLTKVVSKTCGFLADMSTSENVRTSLDKIGKLIEKLKHLFLGVGATELGLVHQTQLKAMAIKLRLILRKCNDMDGLQACQVFMQTMHNAQRFLKANELEPDRFVSELFASLANIEEPKPTVMCKLIQALMFRIHPLPLTVSNQVRKVQAIIHEPTGTSDTPIRFMAGLSASLFLDASLENVQDIFRLRIRVKYPDLHVQLIRPKLNDFRKLGPLRSHLLTEVILSHWLWSEPCPVEISLVLCTPSDTQLMPQIDEDANSIELCKPVLVLVATKPVKR